MIIITKIKYLVALLIVFFINCTIAKADGIEQNVNFNLIERFYSTVTKSYVNGITVFDYVNRINEIDIEEEQLRSLLNQRSGGGSSPLTIYETLNIEVTPLEGTSFEGLINEDTYYRGNGGGSWVNDIENKTILEEVVAEEKAMLSSFWPYGFKVQYRTTPNGEYVTTIPSNTNLNNKTIEEQLAVLLDIDLSINPNGVIDAYNTLYRFKPLNTGYKYLNRFDFYDKKKGITPELESDSTTNYLVSSLEHLGEEYVAIRYYNGSMITNKLEETAIPTLEEVEKEIKKLDIIILIIGPILITGIGLGYYFKNNKKLKLKN